MKHNSSTAYGSVSRFFHWATAVVISLNIAMGFIAHRSSMEAVDAKVLYFSIHKTLGVLAFTLALARICWTLFQPHPDPVHPQRRLETFVAGVVHWMLYGSMLLVPLTGWIEHAATSGYAPILWPFGQDLPLVQKSDELAQRMAATHQLLAWTLCLAIGLHVAGALKHALIDRDGVLQRMTRGKSAGTDSGRAGWRSAMAFGLAAVAFAGVVFASQIGLRAASAPAASLQAATSEWQVTEGTLGFKVKQMGTPVSGSFSDWTASIAFDKATGTGDVKAVINLSSVTLGSVSDQVKGAGFLDAAQHPQAQFTAKIQPEGKDFLAVGTLNLKGIELPVRLPFTMTIKDGVADMAGQTVLDRRDFKVGEGYADEKTVGFPVEVDISLQAKR
ncbi:cytochrome b/b6 domain-containing protein [Rhizobium sp. PP-CC-3G-465]|uniref:cytochrome b/b6 domain-containing protein n=1 Tax=Rhizobium sp. PP-CC-3G-465 TaxID=2135648 RepID=UPI0010E3023B|nr:cytochrome b561 [Rhizobium sp. PP-CC-3G-465]